jgi:antitoxin component YwqK of YwqJK toxin-antitoxin module
MSYINGVPAEDWIEENRPENGVFRVYWKKGSTFWGGDATLDPNEGKGLRYEFHYKDGKRADGVSKGWFPSGQLKHQWTWKNNEMNGLWIRWHRNGQIYKKITYKNGEKDGLWTNWYRHGQIRDEGIWKNGKKDGLWTFWYEGGNKWKEVTYKNGKLISSKLWDEKGNILE